MMSNEKNILVDQKLALSIFLDSLLREPVEENMTEQSEALTSEPVVEAKLPEKIVRLQEVVPVVDSKLKSTTVDHQVLPVTEVVVAQTSTEKVWDNQFQVMLFKVAGLTLAVPLDELNGVVEWKDNLTEMPAHADFYLGIMQHLGQSIPVVDTARLVFPRDKLVALDADEPSERITRVILIDDSRWGLAVDAVEEVITLNKEDVRWRSARTSRKWLLGTVIEHMCALLDTKAFAEKLTSGKD
ncbi:MAG: chemotaxis protein CheW [Gammaproteobacteria bacterium]|nr:chemotaxis protein CheW [Gammaproteobacteria bacterium]